MQFLQLVLAWQLMSVPTASQRLDEGNAGQQTILLDQEGSLLVIEESHLGGNHRGIGYGSGLILVQGNVHRILRRLDGSLVHPDLLTEVEVVFTEIAEGVVMPNWKLSGADDGQVS